MIFCKTLGAVSPGMRKSWLDIWVDLDTDVDPEFFSLVYKCRKIAVFFD